MTPKPPPAPSLPPPAQPARTLAPTPSELARRRQLAVTKRRATLLLVAVTCVFVAVTVWGGDATWAGYVEAAAAASMVGGLADWFAVVALFRHPLGLPIPHTAIVVERKDQFAATLGEFVRESFLSRAVLVERVRTAQVVPRLAAWISEPANANRVAAEAADAAVAVSDLLRDDDVHRVVEGAVRQRVERVPLAPLAGKALRFLTQDGRHDPALDAALRGLDRYLDEHRPDLRKRLTEKSPWWLPGPVENRIFDRLIDGVRSVVRDMAHDRDHDLRRQFEARVAKLAVELETSPELRERGEQLKREVLSQPELRSWVASLWRDAKQQLRDQASDPDSELRRRLADALVAGGQRLADDSEVVAMVRAGMESAVGYVAEHFGDEMSELISGTVARWDAQETADRLELLLGPDLQYVRMNGTLVGAGLGLALHAASRVLG